MISLDLTARILDPPEIELVRRGDRPDPIDNRRLKRALATGEWVRVVPGVFARGSAWRQLKPIEQHRLRVCETARRVAPGTVFALHAAASLWGADVLGEWTATIDTIVSRANGGQSSGLIRRHAWGFDGCETTRWGVHWVTTPARTALDLARVSDFVPGVAVVDQVLWERRTRGPLATIGDLRSLHARTPPRRGDGKVTRALDAAASLADNVRETQSRLVIARLGFPTPRLQERRVLRSGRVVYGDLYFPGYDHWCEIDGRGKYRDPVLLAGRTPEQAVIDEKNRENEIRREVRAFSRWEATDADDPSTIWDILTVAGLPAARPRP